MKNFFSFIFVLWLCAACTSTVVPMQKKTMKQSSQILKEASNSIEVNAPVQALPSEVMSDLISSTLPENTSSASDLPTFDVAVNNLPAEQFYLNLMQDSGENMIISPGVSGNISLNLKHVTVPEVLKIVKNMYGFSYKKTEFGYQIAPRSIETKIFYLSYLNFKQSSESSMSVQSVGMSSGTDSNSGSSSQTSGGAQLKTKFDNNAFWSDLQKTISNIIKEDPGSYSNVNTNTGVVLVAAYPDTLEKVANYIEAIQNVNSQQVIIDAKIIEVSLGKGFKTGIDWSQTGMTMSSTKGNFDISAPLSLTDIDAVVSLLSKQGGVTVLSNPRISVTNNQPALIKVGNDSFYVTSVNSGTTPVGTTATMSSNVGLTPFFSGVALDVIPNIMPNGVIKLHIHPTISIVKSNTIDVTLSSTQQLTLPSATTDIREADSNVRMKSGEIVVLGGLMQHIDQTSATSFSGIPFSASHPSSDDQGAVTELVILIKATLTDKKVWKNEIDSSSERYNELY